MPSGSPPLVGVILAGGSSTRMGRDKLLMPDRGQADARSRDRPSRSAGSADGAEREWRSRAVFFLWPAGRRRCDRQAGSGRSQDFMPACCGRRRTCRTARFIASVAADTPFFPTNFVARLSQGHDPATIALAASSGGTHSVFGLWPIKLADDLETFLTTGENPKVLNFAERHGPQIVSFADLTLPNGETVDPFFNVNTPEDARRAEQIAAVLA